MKKINYHINKINLIINYSKGSDVMFNTNLLYQIYKNEQELKTKKANRKY